MSYYGYQDKFTTARADAELDVDQADTGTQTDPASAQPATEPPPDPPELAGNEHAEAGKDADETVTELAPPAPVDTTTQAQA